MMTMDEILGLPADVTTALTVIVTGVVIPALSAVLNQPGLSKTARRFIPIGLAVVAAVAIVVLQAGGPVAEKLITGLLIVATLVGIAQAVYAVMPGAWKSLEESTTRNDPDERALSGPGATSGPSAGSTVTGADRTRETGAQDARTLNPPEDYTRG